jgi:YVTN family beta-propeller protein
MFGSTLSGFRQPAAPGPLAPRRRHTRLLGLAALAVLVGALASPCAPSAAKAPAFRIQRRIAIGGQGGWDLLAVDAPRHRLYLSHGTRVEVVDLDSNRVVDSLTNTPGVHGVAIVPELGCGFTSNGRDSSVTVFSLDSLTVRARISIPARNPDVILYDSFSGRVFTMNGGSASTTAIDAKTLAVVATVPLGGRPEFAVVDGAGRMYVNLEDSSAVVELDTRSLAPLARWPLAPGEEPTGLALDRAHHRLFSACANQKLIVLDATNGRHVTELPIGKGVDGAAFDQRRALIFTSNGADSSLSVFHEESPDRIVALETATTERGARTLALDEASGLLYLPTADFGPPPPPTPERPNPRPSIIPETFRVLVVGR